jgi:uncharacterized protein (DUF2384 family)
MSFIVIPDFETFRILDDVDELPKLFRLGVEIVLVRPLLDELVNDPRSARYFTDKSLPIEVVETEPVFARGPYPRVHAATVDYLTGVGQERILAGEPAVLVMPRAGAWFVNRPPQNLKLLIGKRGLAERIQRHVARHELASRQEKGDSVLRAEHTHLQNLKHSRQGDPGLTAAEELALVRTTIALLNEWHVNDDGALEILGGLGPSTYAAWQRNSVDKLSPEVVYRLSLLLKIYAALRVRFSESNRAAGWMNRANDLFEGRTPIEVIATHDVRGIERVLTYLVADQSPW